MRIAPSRSPGTSNASSTGKGTYFLVLVVLGVDFPLSIMRPMRVTLSG